MPSHVQGSVEVPAGLHREAGGEDLGPDPRDSKNLCELFRATDLAVALAALFGAFVAANIEQMPGGLEEFLVVRLTVKNLLLLVGFVVLWPLAFAAFSLYDPDAVSSRVGELGRIAAACAVAATSTLVLVLTSESGAFSWTIVPLFWFGSVGAIFVFRSLARRIIGRAKARHRRRILIVGSGARALSLFRTLATMADVEVVGFMDSSPRVHHDEIRSRFLGPLRDLEGLLMREVIDEVLIALPIRSCYRKVQRVITVCERMGVEARYLADVFQSFIATPEYDEFPGGRMVAFKVVRDDVRLVVKRGLDLAGAALGLVLLAPVFLVIMTAVKVTSPGPVFFSQQRYGLNKRLFRMYKFRTMVIDAESLQPQLEHLNEVSGPVFKIRDDPRVTPVGRLLRRTSLDELPQLFNVLRGEMSLVGPRPLPTRDVGRFSEPWLMRRFSVRPGMTGLWQVSGRSDLTFDDWISHDLRYIDQWSLTLDLRILLQTVPTVARGAGAA